MKEKDSLVLIQNHNGVRTEIARIPYQRKEVVLHVEGNDLEVQFSFGESPESLMPIGPKLSLIVIADGQGFVRFNGPGVGMYATSNGVESKNEALYDWFYYQGD
jgi:alpha-N-arabinofuranosidase